MFRVVMDTLCSPGSAMPETSMVTVVSPWFRRRHTSRVARMRRDTVCSAPSEIISPRSSRLSRPLYTTWTWLRVLVTSGLASLPT